MPFRVLEQEGRSVYQVVCDRCAARGGLAPSLEEASENFLSVQDFFFCPECAMEDTDLFASDSAEELPASLDALEEAIYELRPPQDLPAWCVPGAIVHWRSRRKTVRIVSVRKHLLALLDDQEILHWDRRATLRFAETFELVSSRSRYEVILENRELDGLSKQMLQPFLKGLYFVELSSCLVRQQVTLGEAEIKGPLFHQAVPRIETELCRVLYAMDFGCVVYAANIKAQRVKKGVEKMPVSHQVLVIKPSTLVMCSLRMLCGGFILASIFGGYPCVAEAVVVPGPRTKNDEGERGKLQGIAALCSITVPLTSDRKV